MPTTPTSDPSAGATSATATAVLRWSDGRAGLLPAGVRSFLPPAGEIPPLAGEILPPAPVSVAFRRFAFSAERELLLFPAGMTLAEMVASAVPDRAAWRWLAVSVGDDLVLAERWHLVRPKAGTRWRLVSMPRGGDFLRILLVAAVVVAAASLTAASGGLLGPVGAAMLGAAVSIGGTLAINALIPPPQPPDSGAKNAAPVYGLTGTSNAQNLWGPVPRILGRHRFTPPLAAETVTELKGNTSKYLTFVVCWGVGPLQVEDIRIGDTPLDVFDDVQHEFEEGDPGVASDLSLYPTIQHMASFSAQLTQDVGWVTRTTPLGVDRASVEISMPSGMIGYGKKTLDRFHMVVDYEVQFSPSDQDDWTPFPDGDPWRIDQKTETAIILALDVRFPTRGQYDVRVRRLTDDLGADETEKRDVGYWTALKAFTHDPPIRRKGLCLSAFRIKGTAQLSGQVSNLSGVVTSVAPDYDEGTSSWITRPTRNPASLLRLWCEGPGTRVPKRYDTASLEYWHAFCVTQGYKCNVVVDSDRPWQEVLGIIYAAGRAGMRYGRDGYAAIVDEPRPSVGLYTPRNLTSFKAKRVWPRYPHGIRVPFANERQNWAPDERLVFYDGYDETNATKYEQFQLPGITDPDLIFRFGRYHLAAAKLQPERYESGADWEQVVHQRGDHVEVAHDAIAVSVGSSRVSAVEDDGHELTFVVLEDRFATVPGTRYGLRRRDEDYQLDTFEVLPTEVVSNRFAVAPGVARSRAPKVSPAGAEDLVVLGELGRETLDCVILSVRPGKDLTASLTLIPYNEAIYRADTETIPDWDPKVTYPAGFRFPIILACRSDEIVLQRDSDGAVHLRIVVSLLDDGGAPLADVSQVELAWRPSEGAGNLRMVSAPNDADEVLIDGVEADVEYQIQARYRFASGRPGQWSPAVKHTVEGAKIPPPDVDGIYLSGDRIAWPWVSPPDFAGFRVAGATTNDVPWEQATPITDTLYSTAYVLLDELPDDAVELLVKGETTAGVQSRNPGRVALTGIDRPKMHVVFVDDLPSRGWGVDASGGSPPVVWTDASGAVAAWTDAEGLPVPWTSGPGDQTDWQGLVGGEIADGTLRSIDQSRWAMPGTGRWATPRDERWAVSSFAPVEWDFQYTCPSDVLPGDRVRFEIDILAGAWQASFRWLDDIVSEYPDDAPVPDTILDGPDWLPFGTYLAGASVRPFVPWRNGLRPVAGEIINFRVVGLPSGTARPALSGARVIIESAETLESHAPFAIAAGGSTLIPDNKFRQIAYVHATLIGPTAAYKVEVTRADPSGIDLAAYDLGGSSTSTLANVLVAGVGVGRSGPATLPVALLLGTPYVVSPPAPP